MRRPLSSVVYLLAAGLVMWSALSVKGQTGPSFEYRILQVSDTPPGGRPVVTFQVVNADGVPYDLVNDLAFKQTADGTSRLFVQIGWNTRDYTNSGGRTQPLPIGVDVLGLLRSQSAYIQADLGGTYTLTSPTPLPPTATGSGVVALEGHPAGQDATGAWTVRLPVRSTYKYFAITDAAPVARREVVDVNKCKSCHGVLSTHGFNRTDEIRVCVMCHNPNATDIQYRQFADGPEVSVDFKRMIHAIHGGQIRKGPVVIIGRNHSINDFSDIVFPGDVEDCMTCHVGRSFELPLAPGVLGSTINTRSTLTETTKVIDGNPDNDLNITPMAAVCSSCHDDREAAQHMTRNGASFVALQQDIDSGLVRERCVACHGPGREKDVRKMHLDE